MPNTLASMPYIKTEPDEFGNSANNFMSSNTGYGQQNFSNNFSNHNSNGSINPSELSMDNSNFGGMQYGYGSQNMSSSFNVGNSGFGEDELIESLTFSNGQSGMDNFSMHQPNSGRQNSNHNMATQSQMSNMYNNHDSQSVQSPFMGNFDFNQFRPVNSLPAHMSPHQGSSMMVKRPSLQTVHRKSSDQRSPMTPRTAAMAGLHLGTPDSVNLQGRAIRTPSMQNRHQKTLSGQYDSTPTSLQSYLDSPLSSPSNALHHVGISETLGGKHASLPAKVENTSGSTQNLETVEAKKRRRRASHNAVERRRRDNINERIQDLSHLVPQHRLDDDRVRKQLANQGPLSPITGSSNMSPPNAATSLLAGASGRRAASTAGNITLGLPLDDKEKGPNKGDILNGSVSWTRDLMWALHQKYVQEEELAQYITQLGGTWPFQVTEDDRRMRTELMDAMEKNDVTSFQYSRGDGSGLRVPKHTTLAGDKLRQGSSSSPNSNFELSPGFHSGGSGANSGSNGAGQAQYWLSAGHGGISFKEEEELMDMV